MSWSIHPDRAGFVLSAALLIVPVLPLKAANWRVNDTADLPATASCPAEPRGRQMTGCTLRGAIQRANAAGSGPHTITVEPGLYLIGGAPGDDSNESGDLDIDTNVSIEGAGATSTIVRFAAGIHADRVFDILSGQVALKGLAIEGGYLTSPDTGGGIRVRRNLDRPAQVKLVSCRIVSNHAEGGGGGICNGGTLTLDDSDVLENVSGGADTHAARGGGIHNARSAELTVLNSRIAFNQALGTSGTGGGLFSDSVALLRSSLVRYNLAAVGGGVANMGSSLEIENSDISYNEGAGSLANVSPPWASLKSSG